MNVDKPLIMGILNITPDSFHTASRASSDTILDYAEKMLAEGADILDIGGQSTRPGATRISASEELSRVIPAIKSLAEKFPEAVISIDTFYSEVAIEAVRNGASIINDISGGSIDEQMFSVAGSLHVPYVLNHIQGEPQTMQVHPHYDDVTGEVISYFSKKIKELKSAGVQDILLDPGFGFGKTVDHNMELLSQLNALNMFGLPVLVGLSRKKTIQNILGVDAQNALNGTTIMNTIAIMNGASILRVHDVKEASEVVKITRRLKNG